MPANKNVSFFIAFLISFFLTACSSGGSSGGSPSNTAASEPETIEGPLDAVQDPVSSQVMANFANAVAGTPLEGAVDCLDQLVVGDVIDVLDAVLVNVNADNASDPQSLFQQSTADLEQSVSNLTDGLSGFQSALAGGDCQAAAGSNPLAGTPLAPLGDALAAATAGGVPSDLNGLAAYMSGLSTAFQQGLAALSSPDFDSVDVPVLGGMLTTLQNSLGQLETLLQAVANNDATTAQSAIKQTLDSVLSGVLLEVVPVGDIEEFSGQNPVFSLPIGTEVFGLTTLLGSDFSGILQPGFGTGLSAAVMDLLSPLSETELPALWNSISSALANSSYPGGTTSTPLDAVLDPLASIEGLVNGSNGSNELTGLPIDMLFMPIADELNAGDSCPLVGTYLDLNCGIVQGLLDALAVDPLQDLTTVLDSLVDSLL